MYYYKVANLIVKSDQPLPSYKEFSCEPAKADITITETDELPPPGPEIASGPIIHRKLEDGWFFHNKETEKRGLYISRDYTQLRVLRKDDPFVIVMVESEWFIRLAIECVLIRQGFLSLHAAAVEMQEETFAFTGPSGMGKSTRAMTWVNEFGARLVSGDRPLINMNELELYGVPWDGKEKCFRNVHYPLKAICEVRRSSLVYIRKMSFSQRLKLLLRQCFVPMWDTELAAVQMANIMQLASKTEIVRVFCGPTAKDARALHSALKDHQYLKEEKDMKAKQGFILRNVVDEFILMPTGDNIGMFNGTVLLNEVSAFVWEKLKNPISKEDLLKAVLDEFEVEKAVAAADLDTLLATLKEYGVIEDD